MDTERTPHLAWHFESFALDLSGRVQHARVATELARHEWYNRTPARLRGIVAKSNPAAVSPAVPFADFENLGTGYFCYQRRCRTTRQQAHPRMRSRPGLTQPTGESSASPS